MRITALILSAVFLLAAGTASACPMYEQTAKKDQNLAASSSNSTPIPSQTKQDNNG